MKKFVLGLLAFLAVIAIGAHFLWSNMDSFVKTAIEKYGSEATQAAVKVDSVKISITTGEGAIKGMTVGSPAGFNAPEAIALGAVEVNIDTASITGSGPIVIKKIVIDQPQITFEAGLSGSNLQAIARNAQAYASSAAGKASGGSSTPVKAGDKPAPGRKIIIDQLLIEHGHVAVSQSLLQGKSVAAELPTINLTNLGRSSNGATPAEIAQKVLGAVTVMASHVAAGDLVSQMGGVRAQPGSLLKGLLGK